MFCSVCCRKNESELVQRDHSRGFPTAAEAEEDVPAHFVKPMFEALKKHQGVSDQNGSAAKPRIPRASSRQLFPMSCVNISFVLGMKRLWSYGQLDEAGELREPGEDDAVHLVSHQWLGFGHPDPECAQLRRLQEVFLAASSGDAEDLFTPTDWEVLTTHVRSGTAMPLQGAECVGSSSKIMSKDSIEKDVAQGLLWIDFCCAPQMCDSFDDADEQIKKQIAAIKSIPAYVERADYLWILAPNAVHVDTGALCNFNTWRMRGWCRMEEWVNALAVKRKMPLVITSNERLRTIGQIDHIMSHAGRHDKAVCTGEFSCCRMQHLHEGNNIACDKELLAPILSTMYSVKMQWHQAQENSSMRSICCMMSSVILAGSSLQPAEPSADESVENFLARVGFASLDDCDVNGVTPMHIAMILGHWKLVSRIASLRPALVSQANRVGWTPLMSGAHHSYGMLGEIIDAGVGFEAPEVICAATPRDGITALHYASSAGFERHVKVLLQRGASLEARRNDNGFTPLLCAAQNGYASCVEALVRGRADLEARSHGGGTALHLAANPLSLEGCADNSAKLEVIAFLLASGARRHLLTKAGQRPMAIALAEGFDAAVAILHPPITS